MAQVKASAQPRTRWQQVRRTVRRYREVILIILTLAMSLAFLAFGYIVALMLESKHPNWFGNGY